jgi:hypothetical protein
VITGATLSMFEIVIVLDEKFPAASVAVNVTVPLFEKSAVDVAPLFAIEAIAEAPTIFPSFVVAVTMTS